MSRWSRCRKVNWNVWSYITQPRPASSLSRRFIVASAPWQEVEFRPPAETDVQEHLVCPQGPVNKDLKFHQSARSGCSLTLNGSFFDRRMSLQGPARVETE